MTAAWTPTTSSFLFGAGFQQTGINLDIPIDVNGDGRPDLVVARLANFAGQSDKPPVPITILLNDGHGHLKDATSTFFPGGAPTTMSPNGAVVADFNGDGRPDLFISDQNFDGVLPNPGAQDRLFLSSGAHGFIDATANLPQIRAMSTSATAADITGNGVMEIFVNNFYSFQTGTPPGDPSTRPFFLMNDGTGHFTPDYTRLPPSIENASNTNSGGLSLLFDANGDHHPDLLLGVTSPLILLNDGTGNFSNATPMYLPKPSDAHGAITAVAADLTGDGHQDLVLEWDTGSLSTAQYQILMNDGHGNFTDETAQRLPNDGLLPLAPSMQLVDLNGDGYPDIVPRTNPAPILMNDGTGHFIALPDTFPVTHSWWSTHEPNFNPPDSAAFRKLVLDANDNGHMDILYEVQTGIGQSIGNYVLFTRHYPGPVQISKISHDVLFGGNGKDAISGLGGHDIVFGGRGNDNLRGGRGNNYLNGGTGKDTLDGGPGQNTLFGGPGADHFVFDSRVNGRNVDTIVDFTPSQHDKIVLSEAHFHGIGAIGHALAASLFHIGAQASTHSQHIIYDPSNGFLYYDQDGSGRHPQVHFATIAANLDLHHTDVLVAA